MAARVCEHECVAMSLRRMTAAEYEAWISRIVAGYAAEITASGALPAEAAHEKARRDQERALPAGLGTPGHLMFRLVADGQPAGWLWLAVPGPDGDPGPAWVYFVEVDEAFRGHGYGREAMLLAEAEARSRGMRSLGLNVDGSNTVARSLYAGLGYEVMAQQMKKTL
jgi:ribosomal protein S18 acetylase RimI-like enzyme